MNCVCCDKLVDQKKPRAYTWILGIKVAACGPCNQEGKFDSWIADMWEEVMKPKAEEVAQCSK